MVAQNQIQKAGSQEMLKNKGKSNQHNIIEIYKVCEQTFFEDMPQYGVAVLAVPSASDTRNSEFQFCLLIKINENQFLWELGWYVPIPFYLIPSEFLFYRETNTKL